MSVSLAEPSPLEITSAAPNILEERRNDLAIKQQRVAEFLEDAGYAGLLLEGPECFAWFTGGGNNSHGGVGAGHAAVFVTANERWLIATNTEWSRLVEEEVGGLGFQLRQRRWDEPTGPIYEELFAGRRIASDTGTNGTTNESSKLCHLRLVLTPLERQRYRELGRDVSHAIEATARSFEPGTTEAAVAGELAHRLLKRCIVSVEIMIAADDRGAQFCRPIFGEHPVRRRCLLMVTGRRWGLCASASRCVSFGPAPDSLRKRFDLACIVDATSIFFSRPGERFDGLFRRVKRIYEKFEHPHDWMLCDQGGVTGYRPVEILALPESSFCLAAQMAVAWCPTIGSARSQDTVLIDHQGFEILTKVQQWPTNVVSVKGYNVERPSLLVR